MAAAKPPPKTSTKESAKTAPKKSAKTPDVPNYTKPDLRARLKDQIQAGDKGGRAGQWSARKAQLLVAEYEKQGGGYKKGGRTEAQKHLKSWTEEKWKTADGKKAARGKTMARYLPEKAWKKLSPAERKATDAKKKAASSTGQQFVANTSAAKKARKSVVKD